MRTAACISLPSGRGHPAELYGVKSLDVEVDRRGGVVDDEVGGQCGFDGDCHQGLLGVGTWPGRAYGYDSSRDAISSPATDTIGRVRP